MTNIILVEYMQEALKNSRKKLKKQHCAAYKRNTQTPEEQQKPAKATSNEAEVY